MLSYAIKLLKGLLMVEFETLEELQEELRQAQEAKKDIISGRIVTFGKGDTRYRFFSLEDINKEISRIKNLIILKTDNNVC